MTLWDSIVVGGAGGAIAGVTVSIVLYLNQKWRESKDKSRVYHWLKSSTTAENRHRSTRAIASWNNLAEDRVRYICSIDDRIYLSTGKQEDLWGLAKFRNEKSEPLTAANSELRFKAGRYEDIDIEKGLWIILDIGASRQETCGLKISNAEAKSLSYSGATKAILSAIRASNDDTINLVIEAPLSMAYDKDGNPKGRRPEKRGSDNRYWYIGAGAVVALSTLPLIKIIASKFADEPRTIQLFEAFVTFKSGAIPNIDPHVYDVEMIYETLKNKESQPDSFIAPDKLKFESSDQIMSALLLLGLGSGVPLLIVCNQPPSSD